MTDFLSVTELLQGRIYEDTYEFVSLPNGISLRRVLMFVERVRI